MVKLFSLTRTARENQRQYTFQKGKYVFHDDRTGAPWTGDQPIRQTMWQRAIRKSGIRIKHGTALHR